MCHVPPLAGQLQGDCVAGLSLGERQLHNAYIKELLCVLFRMLNMARGALGKRHLCSAHATQEHVPLLGGQVFTSSAYQYSGPVHFKEHQSSIE